MNGASRAAAAGQSSTTNNSDLLLSQDGFVATITINRAEQHNVWSPAMAPMLEGLVRRCGADGSVRVIVSTGAGRSFCAGADVAAFKAAQAAGMRRAGPPQASSHRKSQRGGSWPGSFRA